MYLLKSLKSAIQNPAVKLLNDMIRPLFWQGSQTSQLYPQLNLGVIKISNKLLNVYKVIASHRLAYQFLLEWPLNVTSMFLTNTTELNTEYSLQRVKV